MSRSRQEISDFVDTMQPLWEFEPMLTPARPQTFEEMVNEEPLRYENVALLCKATEMVVNTAIADAAKVAGGPKLSSSSIVIERLCTEEQCQEAYRNRRPCVQRPQMQAMQQKVVALATRLEEVGLMTKYLAEQEPEPFRVQYLVVKSADITKRLNLVAHNDYAHKYYCWLEDVMKKMERILK